MENNVNETKTKEVKEVKETKKVEYLGGTIYQYEDDTIKLDSKELKDVTEDILPRIGKGFQPAIKKIMSAGRYYEVEMNDGYKSLGQAKRIARRVPEIGFIARCAIEEKNGKGYNDYVKEFKENNIAFDGIKIPQFIDTKEDKVKAEEKAKKAEEIKAKKAEKEAAKAENKE